jgi:hypothetical protein
LDARCPGIGRLILPVLLVSAAYSERFAKPCGICLHAAKQSRALAPAQTLSDIGKFVCHKKFSLAKRSYLANMGGQLGKELAVT